MAIFISFVACEPIAPFQIKNNTDQTLGIYIAVTYQEHIGPQDARVHEGDVKPGKEFKPAGLTQNFNTYLIEAKDTQGMIIYSQEFTWEELDWLGWKILIKEPRNQ